MGRQQERCEDQSVGPANGAHSSTSLCRRNTHTVHTVLLAPEFQTVLQPPDLMPFVGTPRQDMPKGLPFPLPIIWSWSIGPGEPYVTRRGAQFRGSCPPILERLQIDSKYWLYVAKHFDSRFTGLVGAAHRLRATSEALGYRRVPNLAACRQLLT